MAPPAEKEGLQLAKVKLSIDLLTVINLVEVESAMILQFRKVMSQS
jgi:hypothetical protein